MFHRLLSLALSLLLVWNPTAMAMSSSSVDELVKLVKQTGLDTKELTLKEFVEKTKGSLPPKMEAEWTQLAARYPQMKLPKVNLKRVKNSKGVEVLQVIADGKQSVVMTIENEGPNFGKIDAVVNGKTQTYALNAQMYGQGPKVLYTKSSPSLPKAWIFDKESYAALSAKDKMAYWKNIHELLVRIENVHGKFQKSAAKSASNLFISNAWAAAGDPCIAAGYVSTFDEKNPGYCKIPDSAIDKSNPSNYKITCNPAFFPKDTLKFDVANPKTPLNVNGVTETCQRFAPNIPERYEELLMKDNGRAVDAQVRAASIACQTPTTPDQAKTCKYLFVHIDTMLTYCKQMAATYIKKTFYCDSLAERAKDRPNETVKSSAGTDVKTGTGDSVYTKNDIETPSEKSSKGAGWDSFISFITSPFFIIPAIAIFGMWLWSSGMKSQMNQYYAMAAPQPTNVVPAYHMNQAQPVYGVP